MYMSNDCCPWAAEGKQNQEGMGPRRQSPPTASPRLPEEGLESNPYTATTRRQKDEEIASSLFVSRSPIPPQIPLSPLASGLPSREQASTRY